jgi:hypothetical protein
VVSKLWRRTNHEEQRTIEKVKIEKRENGGIWRSLLRDNDGIWGTIEKRVFSSVL